jgi:hypothetical protein
MERPNWLDEVHDACRDLRTIVVVLRAKGNAMAVLGMDQLSDEMHQMAAMIDQDQDTIGNAIGGMLSDQVTQGQRQIHETFYALLEQAGGQE